LANSWVKLDMQLDLTDEEAATPLIFPTGQ
jgi:hypothetical protein